MDGNDGENGDDAEDAESAEEREAFSHRVPCSERNCRCAPNSSDPGTETVPELAGETPALHGAPTSRVGAEMGADVCAGVCARSISRVESGCVFITFFRFERALVSFAVRLCAQVRVLIKGFSF